MTETTTPQRAALCMAALVCLLPLPGLAQDLPPPLPPQPEQEVVPPPPPPVEEVLYFVAEGGAAAGPFNLAQLQARVATGGLRGDTKVWAKGMAEWVDAGTVDVLAPLFAAAPPPPAEPALDYSAYIVGAWETTGPVTLGSDSGTHRTVLTFKSDRSFDLFSQGSFSNYQGPYQTRITGQGTYTVHTLGNGRFELRLTGTQTFEILEFPSGGQVSAYSPVIQLTVIDQNTVENGTGQISRRLGF